MDDNSTLHDDGLTDQEREFLQTPVCKVPRDHWATLVAIRDKKAAHNYALNEIYRAEQKAREPQYADD